METKEDLNRLLLWLGEDPVLGARKYEEVRAKLIVLFRLRGCSSPEELADETIDRTARALLKPGFAFDGNPIAYFRGVARNVYLESLRRERHIVREAIEHLEQAVPPAPVNGSGLEQQYACLERCLDTLPAERKALLLDYYRGEKRSKIDQRQKMAASGVGINALRLQVFRMRKVVRNCVENCVRSHDM